MPERRICRLTWNTKKWTSPSGHPYNINNKNKKGAGYESIWGFGHEEWLFNSDFFNDGWQYGFVQGVQSILYVEKLDELHLFTIEDDTHYRYYLGVLTNVETIGEDPEDFPEFRTWCLSKTSQLRRDLLSVGAYVRQLDNVGHVPNIRFRLEDASILPNPQRIQSKDFIGSFLRFRPFHFTSSVEKMLASTNAAPVFHFEPGGPGQRTDTYETSKTVREQKTIEKFHNEIERALHVYLISEKKIKRADLSFGRSSVAGCIPDVVVRINPSSFQVFEIKTGRNVREILRDALGQLLDYAFWGGETTALMVVVSPLPVKEAERRYLVRLNKFLKIPVGYWQYNREANLISDKFDKII